MSVEDYFRGKGCVVTGAASGIGFAVSEALLNVGAVVFIADAEAVLRDGHKTSPCSSRLTR
jgi:NAD(P)-dependent dehydrogenase (short-subunit alcohol dehydrogenase family)